MTNMPHGRHIFQLSQCSYVTHTPPIPPPSLYSRTLIPSLSPPFCLTLPWHGNHTHAHPSASNVFLGSPPQEDVKDSLSTSLGKGREKKRQPACRQRRRIQAGFCLAERRSGRYVPWMAA